MGKKAGSLGLKKSLLRKSGIPIVYICCKIIKFRNIPKGKVVGKIQKNMLICSYLKTINQNFKI